MSVRAVRFAACAIRRCAVAIAAAPLVLAFIAVGGPGAPHASAAVPPRPAAPAAASTVALPTAPSPAPSPAPTPAPSPAPTTAPPAAPLDTLRAAEQAYEQGMSSLRQDPAEARRLFEQSARLYGLVRDQGADNAALHFNLGNAQLQAGRLGESIASYLRAQQSAPGETRVQRNLAHARSLVTDRFESAGATTLLENAASWWHVVSLPLRWWIAIGAWILLWTLMLVRALRPSVNDSEGLAIAWRWGIGASIAAVVIVGGTIAADAALERWRPRGVIVEHGVVVRKGNGEGFEPAFQESLGEGVEFRVRDRRPGWVEIELPNGRGGWIRAADAALI